MSDEVRIFRTDSDQAIVRLAQRDSRRPPSGPLLVAAVDGEARVALPLDGGAVIADPFHQTAGLVALLELHAAELRGHDGGAAASRRPRAFRALRLRAPATAGAGQ